MHICAEINNCGMDSGGRDKGKPMIRKKKKKKEVHFLYFIGPRMTKKWLTNHLSPRNRHPRFLE